MTNKTIEKARMSLILSPLSGRIYAANVKTVGDNEKTWAEATGKKYDVTSDFYHVLFALADMLPASQMQGDFFFRDEAGTSYEVTIKAATKEITP